MRPTLLLFASLVFLSSSGCKRNGAEPGDGVPLLQPQAKVTRSDQHLLLVLDVSRTTFALSSSGLVEGPIPARRTPPAAREWRLDVTDATGKLLYAVPLPPAAVLRGEFKPDAGRVEALRIHNTETAIPVRIPLLEGASEVRLLAQARSLPETDARVQGKRPAEWVELGRARLAPSAAN